MIDNKKLSLYAKIKLKNIIDTSSIVIFTLATLFVIFKFNNSLYSASAVLFCFVALFITQMQIVKKILFGSFQETLIKNLELSQEAIMDILDTCAKQRELLIGYENLIDNIKSFCYKLKNFTTNTKNSADTAIEKTRLSIDFANNEYQNIENSIDKMFLLKQKTQIIAGLILELSEHIQQISSTTSVVENIAEQTNMLALNTAVEAARAGEYGKGFAVVAGEIRKLADESKQATHKISFLINNIQQVANSTVIATEEEADEIENAVKIVQIIDDSANSLKNSINDIRMSIENIINQNELQTDSSGEIDYIVKNLEKNTLLSTEILEKHIECINLLNQTSQDFNNKFLDK